MTYCPVIPLNRGTEGQAAISRTIYLVVLPNPNVTITFDGVVETWDLRKLGHEGAWIRRQRMEEYVVENVKDHLQCGILVDI